MTITAHAPVPAGDAPDELDPLSARVNENVRVRRALLGGMSERRLAVAAGMSQSALNRRTLGRDSWEGRDIVAVARALHVPWHWLMMPTPEFVAKCTAGDLNPEPADSLHKVVTLLAAGVRPSKSSASSPRSSTTPMGLVRPSSAGASSPRRRAA